MRKQYFRFFTVLLSFCFLYSSCAQNTPVRSEFVLGTVCTLNLFDEGTANVYSEVFARLNELDAILSANRDDSNIAKINNGAGIEPVKAAAETLTVLQAALVFSEKTEGLFDPSVGPLVKAWNIGTDYAAVPSSEKLKEALSLIDYKKISIDDEKGTVFLREKGMKLDLGAIAKGYAADEIVRILARHNIKKAIIDLGGNIYAFGEKAPGISWKIGVRDPEETDGASIMTIQVQNKSIVTSGVYERFFEQDGMRYHHILDTRTGYPSENDLLSVTIITGKSIQADALSTTTFLLGSQKGLIMVEQMEDVEAVFISRNRVITATSGVRDSIKILDGKYSESE